MLDYAALQALAAVAREGSFDRAARALGVTPSAVSQRVKLLEERVGTVLVVRGQPCVPTEAGTRLCRHVEQVRALEGGLAAQWPQLLRPEQDASRATLPIATNADSLATWFLAPLSAFARKSGHLVDISVDDQEHTGEWLRRGRVMAAVTSEAEPVAGCRSIALGALRYRATASPDFIARHGLDRIDAARLAAAPALTFNKKDRLQETWIRSAIGRRSPHATHWLPSTQGFVEACLSGMGWGLNPEALVDAHIAAGRLVELVPGLTLDSPLFWQVNRISADLIRDLTDEVRSAARTALHRSEA